MSDLKDFKKQKEKILTMYPQLFPTEASFWAYIRGALRRGLWERSSIKLKFKNSVCKKPPEGYVGRAKSGANCYLTGEWFPKSYLEIDHREGNIPLRSEEDLIGFIIHMLATEDELEVVGKEAHKIKSYAEKEGISFEEAVAVKKAIQLCKDNLDKEWLLSHNLVPASNKASRREQIINHLKGN